MRFFFQFQSAEQDPKGDPFGPKRTFLAFTLTKNIIYFENNVKIRKQRAFFDFGRKQRIETDKSRTSASFLVKRNILTI